MKVERDWFYGFRQTLALSVVGVLAASVACAAPQATQTQLAASEQSAPPAPGRSPEYDKAFAAMAQDPGNADKTLAFAEIAVKAGDLEGAIAALERLLVFNPNLPTIRAELGMLYYRLGSYALAQSYLDKALASPDLPPALRASAEATREQMIAAQQSNRLSGSLSLGFRGQTNANAGPDGGVSRILGFDLLLTDQFQNRADENVFGALSLHHTYDPHWDSGITWDSNASLYGAKQFHLLQLSLMAIGLDTGPSIPVDGWAGDIIVRPYVAADTIQLSGNPYYTDFGAGLSATVPVTAGGTLNASLESKDLSYHASQLDPRANDRAGPATILTLTPSYALSDSVILALNAQGARVDTRGDYQSYWKYTFLPTVSYGFNPGLWDGGPWQSSLYFGRSWSNYDEPDFLIDPFTKRRDREWDLGGALTVPVFNSVAVQVQLQQAWVESTIPNYSFSNFTGQTALVFGF